MLETRRRRATKEDFIQDVILWRNFLRCWARQSKYFYNNRNPRINRNKEDIIFLFGGLNLPSLLAHGLSGHGLLCNYSWFYMFYYMGLGPGFCQPPHVQRSVEALLTFLADFTSGFFSWTY